MSGKQETGREFHNEGVRYKSLLAHNLWLHQAITIVNQSRTALKFIKST